jgi:WD40 repeat protein
MSVAFSADDRGLAAGGWGGDAALWDWPESKQRRAWEHADVVFSVAFRPKSRLLATACADGQVRLWDATTGQEEAQAVHSSMALAAAFSPDGSRLAVAGGHITEPDWHPCEVRLWDVAKLLTRGKGGSGDGERRK